MLRKVDIDINSPRVRELVKQNTAVFQQCMNGMVEACQIPEATKDENVALVLRSAVAYASGICKTFNVRPEAFAELMHLFDDVKIAHQVAPKLKG